MNTGGGSFGRPAFQAWLRGILPAALGTAVLALSIIGLGLSDRGIALASGFPFWLALAGLVALIVMVVAAWLVRRERPMVATGLSVAIVGFALPSWTAWDWVPLGVLPILLAAAPLAVPGVAQVGLGWSRHTGRPGLLAAYVLAGLSAGVLLIGYEPLADPGCVFTCARTDPIAGSILGTRAAVVTAAALLAVAATTTLWGVTGDRRTQPILRWGTGGSLVLLIVSWALRAWQWMDPVPTILWILPLVLAAVLLAGSVLVAFSIVRRDRLAAEGLIADLSKPGGRVGNQPVRAVEFAVPGEDRWVDAAGGAVTARAVEGNPIVLRDGGEPAVRLWVETGIPHSALDEISAAARVALANARLAAATRARLNDVQSSQRRIAEATEVERRRIERDLHDGAQQRLITASLHISLAARQLPTAAVDGAQTAIAQALEHLRHLAHGLGPDATPGNTSMGSERREAS
jgi:signal transduction histidine kinase